MPIIVTDEYGGTPLPEGWRPKGVVPLGAPRNPPPGTVVDASDYADFRAGDDAPDLADFAPGSDPGDLTIYGSVGDAREDLLKLSDIATAFLADGVELFDDLMAGSANPGFVSRVDAEMGTRAGASLARVAEDGATPMGERAAGILSRRLEARRRSFRKLAAEKTEQSRKDRVWASVAANMDRLMAAARANPAFLPVLADEMELMTIGQRSGAGGDAGLEELRQYTRPLLYGAGIEGFLARGNFVEAKRMVERQGPLGDAEVKDYARRVRHAERAARIEAKRAAAERARQEESDAMAVRTRTVAKLESGIRDGTASDGAIAAALHDGRIGRDQATHLAGLLEERERQAQRTHAEIARVDGALSRGETLDPASPDDRAAADAHYTVTLGKDGLPDPKLLLAHAARTGIAPNSAVRMLTGVMLAGAAGEKAAAARTLAALMKADSTAADSLSHGERRLIGFHVELAARSVSPATAEKLAEKHAGDIADELAGGTVPVPAMDPNALDTDVPGARHGPGAPDARPDGSEGGPAPQGEPGPRDEELQDRDELDDKEERAAFEEHRLNRLEALLREMEGGSFSTGDLRRSAGAIVESLDRHQGEVGAPDPRVAEILNILGGFVPGLGEILSGKEAVATYRAMLKAAASGELDRALELGGDGTIAALGAIPGIGSIIRVPKMARGLARLASRSAGRVARQVKQSLERLHKRYPRGSVHTGTPEIMEAYLADSRAYRDALRSSLEARGLKGKELESAYEGRLRILPISKFKIGNLPANMIADANRYVPAFGKLKSRALTASSRVLTKVDETRPKQTKRILDRLYMTPRDGAEVLPNPNNPNRVLLLYRGKDGSLLSVAEAEAKGDGVEIVTMFLGASDTTRLVQNARDLASKFRVGGK